MTRAGAAAFLSLSAGAQQVKPYILFDFDTSLSMNIGACGGTGDVDDTSECAGADVSCAVCNTPGCGDGIPNDSRLWKVKKATTDVVNSFGEATYALARFHHDPAPWACKRGAWNTANVANCQGAPVGTGLNRGDIVVPFSEENQADLLDWLDGCDNWPTSGACDPVIDLAPDTGCNLCADCGGSCDKELRGALGTALGGSMWSVREYLENQVMPTDPALGCRPYAALVLTDGAETCNGDPPARAAELCAIGVPTYVIGFAAPSLQAALDAIADAGCEAACDLDFGTPDQTCRDTAIMVDNETDLALAFGEIIQGSVLAELCNGEDDDCDGLTDEDFPGLGEACCDPCAGTVVCDAAGTGTICGGVTPCPEICNLVDDDCDGAVDEVIPACLYEVCNAIDDDGDGLTDEPPLPGLGQPCGIDIGECERGNTCCAQGGTFACCDAAGPEPEICNCLDDNCNALTDESAATRCYTGNPSECPNPQSGACLGQCLPGLQVCVTTGCPSTPGFGPCVDEVGPEVESCNCLDDDCDGLVDDGATCANGAPCLNCTCAPPCDTKAEFPCAQGHVCSCSCSGEDPPCFCRADPCYAGPCPAEQTCDPCSGACIDPCAACPPDTTCCAGACCPSWNTCLAGQCLSCGDPRIGCPEGQACVGARCVEDPCRDVDCASDEFCLDGECLSVCPECPDGQRCQDGACVRDPCADVTCQAAGELCCEGTCVHDPCIGATCGAGLVCNSCQTVANLAIICEDNTCARIRCPDGFQCRDGDCHPLPPGRTVDLSATGAGGCACDLYASPPTGVSLWFLLIALGLRRRV